MDLLEMFGRNKRILDEDIASHEDSLRREIESSRFLIIGGAGSIGQAVTKEIFRRSPEKLHVVDISENNLVELVRDIRGSFGYIDGDFRTFAIDCGSVEFEAMFASEGPYDYVLNLSALKHVRSEKDPYTLMRMVDVNILNTIKTIDLARASGARKYFCVSTDKAANPANMMGASKRIMEMFLSMKGSGIPISTARFANVAFSDGSLLHGFNMRIQKRQPIAAPNDVRRYFVLPEEAGRLCLISTILGRNGDILFPKLSEDLNLVTFSSIAEKYLEAKGYDAVRCSSEDEAREKAEELIAAGGWPCCFFPSDTTGEKDYEEFFTKDEDVDLERFHSLGVVANCASADEEMLRDFLRDIEALKRKGTWSREDLVALFFRMLPEFGYKETGKYLDSKM